MVNDIGMNVTLNTINIVALCATSTLCRSSIVLVRMICVFYSRQSLLQRHFFERALMNLIDHFPYRSSIKFLFCLVVSLDMA